MLHSLFLSPMELFGCPNAWHNNILSQNDNKILHNEAAHHVGLQDMKLKNMLENIINK